MASRDRGGKDHDVRPRQMTAIEIPARPIPKVALGRETMEKLKFYIDGAWVDPATPSTLGVVNPATEETFATISLGSQPDVDRAVKAVRRAFAITSQASVETRLGWLRNIIAGFRA